MKKLCALLLTISFAVTAMAQERVRILCLQFESQAPVEIGKRTSTILGLQIWQTLRKPPSSPYIGGGVWWSRGKLPKGYEEAESVAQQQKKSIRLVLWGKAFQYGNGIIVQSYLSLLRGGIDSRRVTNFWNASVGRGKLRRTVSVSVPEWRHEFAPIVLRSDLIPEINEAAQLKLYARNDRSVVIGDLSDLDFSLIAPDITGEYYLVKHRGQIGWIHLANLTKERSEVVDFCGGIIRILRSDWDGGVELLQKVVDNSNAPTSVKVDAYLYMAFARENMGDQSESLKLINHAYNLNPYLKKTIQYLCMSHLANISRLHQQRSQRTVVNNEVETIRDILRKNRYLFSEREEWLTQVDRFLSTASEQTFS